MSKCLSQKEVRIISVVITGLVPVIQIFSAICNLDCRNKSGNDTREVSSALTVEMTQFVMEHALSKTKGAWSQCLSLGGRSPSVAAANSPRFTAISAHVTFLAFRHPIWTLKHSFPLKKHSVDRFSVETWKSNANYRPPRTTNA